MSFMSPGKVVWFEIGTANPDAVTDFYGRLLGWSFEVDEHSSVDGRTYTRILAPGAPWPMGAIAQAAGLEYSFYVVGALVSLVMIGIAVYLWRNPEIAKAGED